MIEEGAKIKYRNGYTLVSDLPYHSHKEAPYICDFCGDRFMRVVRERNYSYENSPFDSCGEKNCTIQKREASNTNKFGVAYPAMSEDVLNKMKETSLQRYGVKNVMALPEFVDKIAESKMKNGTNVFSGGVPRVNGVYASFPQINIGKTIQGKVNYQTLGKWIDVALPDYKVAIEYDGSGHMLSVYYGQKTDLEFYLEEIEFMNRVFNSDWRLIRIINKEDKELDYQVIKTIVNHFINSDDKYLKFTIS